MLLQPFPHSHLEIQLDSKLLLMMKHLIAFHPLALISHNTLINHHPTVTSNKFAFSFSFSLVPFSSTGVTILLSLTVFLNMVAETMPATSDAVPLLGKINCSCRILFVLFPPQGTPKEFTLLEPKTGCKFYNLHRQLGILQEESMTTKMGQQLGGHSCTI